MGGKIVEFCIRHRVTTILAFLIVSIFGVVYLNELQLALLPNMEYPAAVVYCYYNGAAPEDMEQLVTRPLESAIMSVPGVDSVSSTSAESISTVTIMYVKDTDLDIAATKLREKFDALTLPEDCSKPVIMNINVSDMMPSAILALMGEDLTEVQALAEDIVVPALERIEGVASVTYFGGFDKQIAVELNAARTRGLGLTNSYVAQILAAENLLYPGGDLENGNQKLTVSTDAQLRSVEEVRNIIIPLQTGGTVRLGDVATVEMETTEQRDIGEMNGIPAVFLQVSKQSGANEAAVADKAAAKMAELAEKNAAVVYDTPYLASEYINIVVNAAIENIILGVVLAAVVVFLFLRRFGATLAIAVSMPVCILTVFVLMYVCDLTMNLLSLGGIAMGVGMIVDNSIVVLENIFRYANDGYDRKTACIEGTREVMLSLSASTLTTVAVFLPLGVADGLAGMIFKDFCLTISFLILGSLAIAVTLVPLLCYFLIDDEKLHAQALRRSEAKAGRSSLSERLLARYRAVLSFFVNHLGVGVLTSVALVAVFVVACLSTKQVLLPDMDMNMIQGTISMPIGSNAEQTAVIAEQMVDIIYERVPELEGVYYSVGESENEVGIILKPLKDRNRRAAEIANDLRVAFADIAGCEYTISAMDMSQMMTGNDIEVKITGTDYGTLTMIANDLIKPIAALPDAIDVKSTVSEDVPQVKVTMKRDAAAQFGLTAAQIGQAVRSELTGATATRVNINNKEIDVVVRGDGAASVSLDALRSMSVATPYGGVVPLSSVAQVDMVLAPASISRVNQARTVTITGASVSGDTNAITENVRAILDSYTMPDGYEASIGGGYEQMSENFHDLTLALVVALGLVYFVLASQFESFIMPIIVMMILPVSFSGALFALPLTGRDLSMISMVALIMLAGTVVNASIILIDYIKQRRERGEDRTTAILNACPLRIRPVLMTTLTTILAILPLALGIGQSNEMMSDMGVTMVSGMLVSTIVTLLFTPVYYCVIDNISSKKKKTVSPS
ncbi:MAG: efflux RND transporter permease subunit [Oscillospiraceae bacterium]|nr:efflux RND transporter permease subunit [Oscillospiraceae bacterium]